MAFHTIRLIVAFDRITTWSKATGRYCFRVGRARRLRVPAVEAYFLAAFYDRAEITAEKSACVLRNDRKLQVPFNFSYLFFFFCCDTNSNERPYVSLSHCFFFFYRFPDAEKSNSGATRHRLGGENGSFVVVGVIAAAVRPKRVDNETGGRWGWRIPGFDPSRGPTLKSRVRFL